MRERKLKRAQRSIPYLSADEEIAMVAALKCLGRLKGPVCEMEERLADISLAIQRTRKRRESDARTDGARRKLVGARLPLEDAERCRKCAELEGVSLYRFVVRALQVACETAETAAAQRLAMFSER
ncbi:MAG: hypothetical protein E7440_05625 [Ruminococcaceae bacterium]|nr:hypothetical protein [Oscillospiraceae bacterium]